MLAIADQIAVGKVDKNALQPNLDAIASSGGTTSATCPWSATYSAMICS